MNFYSLLTVGLGGFLGSVARYATARMIDQRLNSFFPYGTLTVNILGSFILGLIMGTSFKSIPDQSNWRLFLTTGFCGGFTTFSTFAFENVSLSEQRLFSASVAYIVLSIVFGLLAVVAGIAFGKFLSQD